MAGPLIKATNTNWSRYPPDGLLMAKLWLALVSTTENKEVNGQVSAHQAGQALRDLTYLLVKSGSEWRFRE